MKIKPGIYIAQKAPIWCLGSATQLPIIEVLKVDKRWGRVTYRYLNMDMPRDEFGRSVASFMECEPIELTGLVAELF